MSVSPQSPRLIRFAVLAVTGAAALSIAACTSSHKSSPTSTPTSTSTSTSTSAETSTTTEAPAEGQAKVSGLVASVAGNAIQVTQKDDSNATVDYTPTTKITETTSAALTDVTTGSCVSVWPAKAEAEAEAGQPVKAASVRVKPAVDGKCPPGPKPAAASSSPAPSGSAAPPPAEPMRIRGTVASVANNTINVTTNDAAGNPLQTAVTVDDKTTYTKQAEVTLDAITAGKCIKARGTEDSAGKLQATSIKLREAVDGKCDMPARHGHGG
ncbi:DUF5666 domain-containing protein [Mycobacterium sp. Lab-001]|uniref:DUF5666 domain-containing protein n=1 Tax=Mycobacterium sp. Lab-001 TaxID=3410136 RepID=UPI003D17B87C